MEAPVTKVSLVLVCLFSILFWTACPPQAPQVPPPPASLDSGTPDATVLDATIEAAPVLDVASVPETAPEAAPVVTQDAAPEASAPEAAAPVASDPDLCLAACINLRMWKCKEYKPTCVADCRVVGKHRTFGYDSVCIAAAKDMAAVKKCQNVKCN